ncbi:MAG: nickel-dependent hydrogenase large subunit [Anaerolineales bacterium]|nr:nickel-dependent hydrogenase large subunit [Anaerolineales bacterium]
MTEKRIRVDYLPRVEGEGGLKIKIRDDQVTEVQVHIFEPPRFFEAFLIGRGYNDVVDIVARICGICPAAYQMSASHALEKALGITPPAGVRELRRLYYFGEWIESHALHVYMLHAPDFLGYPSVLEMAAEPALRPTVEQALRMKKIGNQIMTLIGGREVHPISPCVGGFSKAPRPAELNAMLPDLEWGLEASLATTRWAATLNYPNFETDYEFVSLSHPDEYPLNEGTIRSSTGRDVPFEEFEKHYLETHVEHSTSLHSQVMASGNSYMVGPLARVNLNFERFSPVVKSIAEEIGFSVPERNPFKSLIARCLEIVQAYDESIYLIKNYQQPRPSRAAIPAQVGPGEGCHGTEAPRGLCYHHYRVDDKGLISFAKITPPTAQNYKRMEQDLWEFTPGVLHLPLEQATAKCEQLVRCYDPCISCSVHALNVVIERE